MFPDFNHDMTLSIQREEDAKKSGLFVHTKNLLIEWLRDRENRRKLETVALSKKGDIFNRIGKILRALKLMDENEIIDLQDYTKKLDELVKLFYSITSDSVRMGEQERKDILDQAYVGRQMNNIRGVIEEHNIQPRLITKKNGMTPDGVQPRYVVIDKGLGTIDNGKYSEPMDGFHNFSK